MNDTLTTGQIDAAALLAGATPGPWTIGRRNTYDNTLMIAENGRHGGAIAMVCPRPFYEPNAPQDSNARLIAASPQLAQRVVALEAALRECADRLEKKCARNAAVKSRRIIARARAALAGHGRD